MKKKLIQSNEPKPEVVSDQWLDLESVATVEVTSEDPSFPVEGALSLDGGPGWRASENGQQQIRILFDEPRRVQRIQLRFREEVVERTQEFTLSWASTAGEPMRDIVRQQWNFSPGGSTTESETYVLDLPKVAVLELNIRPDIGEAEHFATLESWLIG